MGLRRVANKLKQVPRGDGWDGESQNAGDGDNEKPKHVSGHGGWVATKKLTEEETFDNNGRA